MICKECKRWELRIKNEKNFSLKWIRPGSNNVEKDSVKKHIASDQHKAAKKLSLQSALGASNYHEEVVRNTPIGRGLRKMHEKDKESLIIKFNTAYYLAKKERPFSDYEDLLKLQIKNKVPGIKMNYKNERTAAIFTDYIGSVIQDSLKKDLSDCFYFSCLNDGSTDSSTIEQEMVYVLFLQEGTPVVKYLSVESVKSADANGIKESLEEAFKRVGIEDFTSRLLGLNVDGASVNTGIHHSVSALLKKNSTLG